MIIKFKRIGSSVGGFTQNNIYIVFGVSSDRSNLLNDNGKIEVVTHGDLNNPTEWELVSIETAGTIQLYP